jgi:hypothetical protein
MLQKNAFSLKGLTSIHMVYIFERNGRTQNKVVAFSVPQTANDKRQNFQPG